MVDPDCQDILDILEDNRNWFMNLASRSPVNPASSAEHSPQNSDRDNKDDDDDDDEFVDCNSVSTQ